MTKKQWVTYQHQLTVTTPICFPGSDTEFPPCSGFRIRHYSVETSRGQHSATQTCSAQFSSVAQSCPDSLRPHESQHTRPPCPSPTPGGAGSSQFLVIQAQGMLTQQGLSAEPALCTRHSWKPLPHEEMEAPTAPFILKLQDWDQVPSFHEWDLGPWDLPSPAHLPTWLSSGAGYRVPVYLLPPNPAGPSFRFSFSLKPQCLCPPSKGSLTHDLTWQP